MADDGPITMAAKVIVSGCAGLVTGGAVVAAAGALVDEPAILTMGVQVVGSGWAVGGFVIGVVPAGVSVGVRVVSALVWPVFIPKTMRRWLKRNTEP